MKLQLELNRNPSNPGRYHGQGFAKLRKGKQLEVGHYDSSTKEGAGIKNIFQANLHLDYANGTDEQNLAYTGKDYDRCKNPDHQPCKCDFFDLSKICKKCNKSCERPFARISKDTKIAGPWEWIFDESKYTLDSEDEEVQTNPYDIATEEVLKGEDIDKVIIKYAPSCKKWSQTPQGLERIAKAIKKRKINPLKNIKRFWEPCIIYIYGDTGTGKSELCKDLFPGMYEKDDIKQFEEYNNDEFNYNRDNAILLDDFYGSNITWTNFLRLTDRNHCRMDVKYGKTHIVAMYICITANGPIENLYKKLRESNSSINIDAFIRRVRFIIKFEGNPIDTNIGKGDVIRIFEKGNKQDFNNRIFDIEFNKGTTLEQAKEVTTDLGTNGTILHDLATGLYYWRQNWTNEINKYSTTKNIDDITDQIITNIPKSKPGERVIAFLSNKNYQNTERKINTVEAISSKKQNQNDNLIEEPDLQAELSGYNSSFSAY
ncbi:5187_t:CDS:1, partial [Dentiscutata heterogama]